MTGPIPVVWHRDTLLHDPRHEVWLGTTTPASEVAQRVEQIRTALVGAGHPLTVAAEHDDRVLRSVHDPGFVDFLADAYRSWLEAGLDVAAGQPRVVPYVFPTPAMAGGTPLRLPRAMHARTGWYCYDTMTLIGPGTYRAARAAVDTAQSAADLVLAGARAAYALARPPGHHATRAGYGGSCYLNSAAVAAQSLRQGGVEKVAVIDIDAHHGNGTQEIFYDRADVGYGSVHIDPDAGYFPHMTGMADDTGRGPGRGCTWNVPLAPGDGDREFVRALQQLRDALEHFGAQAIVVSLGVDAAGADPESPLAVTADGYRQAGTLLAELGVPCVLVQEGGYDLSSIGDLVAATLAPLSGR